MGITLAVQHFAPRLPLNMERWRILIQRSQKVVAASGTFLQCMCKLAQNTPNYVFEFSHIYALKGLKRILVSCHS